MSGEHWPGPRGVFHTLLRYPVWMTLERNERPLEAGIHTDLAGRMTYGGYSETIVVTERFVLKVPETIDPAGAGFMFEGGRYNSNKATAPAAQ